MKNDFWHKLLSNKTLANALKTPFYAFLAAVLTVAVLLFLSTKNPLQSLALFFYLPFSSSYYVGSMLNQASLLAFAAIGMCISFRAGSFNLGGEGQVCIGGFITAVLLNALKGQNPLFALPLAFAAAALASGVLGFVSGILKAYRNVNELLTSFLISSAILPLVDYAVSVPLRDPEGMLLATPYIEKAFRFKSLLKPSAFNFSFFIAVLLSLAAGFFLFRTRTGYRISCTGIAPEFSNYCGFKTKDVSIWSMCFSAFAHGMTGFFAVTGTYYTCHAGFYGGMGWNALSVALIAKNNPFFALLSALLLSYVFTATDCAVLENNMNFNSSYLIQGIVLFAVSVQFIVSLRNSVKGENR